jgi:predicted trehalose synthase
MMTTAAEMTDKQRRALEAMEAARAQGCSLTGYARAHGLVIREIYDALAALRRKGALVKSTRRSQSKFVSVRVAPTASVIPGARPAATPGVLCRIAHAAGYAIECMQWPPPSWLSALSSGSTDAAP